MAQNKMNFPDMSMDEKTARINELYHKKESVGLTDEEAIERKALMQDYILSIRNSVRSQLDNIDIVEADGSVTPLKDKKKN